jgi:hypothetical protein
MDANGEAVVGTNHSTNARTHARQVVHLDHDDGHDHQPQHIKHNHVDYEFDKLYQRYFDQYPSCR